MGAVEEGVKGAAGVATGVVESFRQTPYTLAMIVLSLGLMGLLYYYMNRITTRTEVTVHELFLQQDKLFTQWAGIIKDTNSLTEKALHCILPEDALKLLQAPPRPYGSDTAPARPEAPVRPNSFRPKSPVFKEIDVPLFQPLKFPEDSK